MMYDVSFKLTNPETKESYDVKGVVEFQKSGAFDYGNEMAMIIDYAGYNDIMGYGAGSSTKKMYDIRYDRRYRSDDQRGYIKAFLRGQYDGKDGDWKATYITIRNHK